MSIILLALLAAAGFGLATLLVDTVLGTSRAFHHVSVVIAAGILLGVALADLVPETLELLEPRDAALWIGAGFVVLFLVEALSGGHTHHHEPHGHTDGAHAHTHAHAHVTDAKGDPCVPTHAVLPFLIGLAIHNLADGLVIGASHEVSEAASVGVAIGILVHQLPVGLSFAAVLLASGISRTRMRRDAAMVAVLIPVGALVVLVAPDLADHTLGALIGIATGALLYIATGHLLPEAQSEERRPGIAAAFAISLFATVLFVAALHDRAHSDERGHEDEPAHADEARDHA